MQPVRPAAVDVAGASRGEGGSESPQLQQPPRPRAPAAKLQLHSRGRSVAGTSRREGGREKQATEGAVVQQCHEQGSAAVLHTAAGAQLHSLS